MQNLQIVSTKYLRDNLAEILEKVAIGGESFQVQKFGRIKAIIVPPQKVKRSKAKKIDFSQFPAFGIWKDRKDMKSSTAWVTMIRDKNSKRMYDIK